MSPSGMQSNPSRHGEVRRLQESRDSRCVLRKELRAESRLINIYKRYRAIPKYFTDTTYNLCRYCTHVKLARIIVAPKKHKNARTLITDDVGFVNGNERSMALARVARYKFYRCK